jgi:DNA-binding transcriptional ArsR family regulator
LRELFEEGSGKAPASKELRMLLKEADQSMSCIPKEAVDRMTRLIGDSDKAECKVNKLRSLTIGLDEAELKSESEIFQAMADPCRLKILSLLREGELCACEIEVGVDRPQSSTSHHLSILKEAGLIKERKDGRWSKFRLSDGAVIEILNLVKHMREDKF